MRPLFNQYYLGLFVGPANACGCGGSTGNSANDDVSHVSVLVLIIIVCCYFFFGHAFGYQAQLFGQRKLRAVYAVDKFAALLGEVETHAAAVVWAHVAPYVSLLLERCNHLGCV